VPEDEHSTADEMTLRSALRTSSNRAAVQVLEPDRDSRRRVAYAQKLERWNTAERTLTGRSAPAT
jgi:hypothetical protein